MRTDNRWLILFVGNIVFLWIVGQLNHHLTLVPIAFGRGPVFMFLAGLPIAFAALRLSLRPALAVTIPTALAMEAGLPIPHGTLLLTSVACVCLTIGLRGSFNRFEPSSAILTVLAFNLALMLALTVATGTLALQGQRIAIDVIVSQSIAGLLTGWFFSAELALLRLFGIDLDTELRESP